ncbi:MAG TPA: hypothetical protein VFM37_03365, partial [Pseudonocardiaceae bacterium]|nr:hypothetical protein [Pseudonocardiaceae bacterium]
AGRQWEAETSHDDRYLHPVIRRRVNHRVDATLRLPEDICNDWTDDKLYRAPLRAFMEASFVQEPFVEEPFVEEPFVQEHSL